MSTRAKATEIAQAALWLLAVPALWPLSFIGAATFLPGSIDPLLGGLQNVLYVPALVWLVSVLLTTLGIARAFRLKRTNVLFCMTSVGLALVVSIGLCTYLAWGDYQLIGQKGVIYPDHFDAIGEVVRFSMVATFSATVSFMTACLFTAIGGFRLWKSKP